MCLNTVPITICIVGMLAITQSAAFCMIGITATPTFVTTAPSERFKLSSVSVNFTDASIESSLSTIPSSFAFAFSSSTDFELPFKSGINSLPERPRSSFASAAFSAPSGIPCNAFTVISKTCSGDLPFRSSTDIPILPNALTAVLLPPIASSIVLLSFFMPP